MQIDGKVTSYGVKLETQKNIREGCAYEPQDPEREC